jgi:hypothetical protein
MHGVKDFETVKKNCRAFWARDFIGRPFCRLTPRKRDTPAPPYGYGYSYVKYVSDARKGDYLNLARQYAKTAESLSF